MTFSTPVLFRVLLLVAGSFSAFLARAEADDGPEASPENATETASENAMDSAEALRSLMAEADQILTRFDDEITQYSCLLVKRERNGDRLSAYQYIWMKVRERRGNEDDPTVPFGVYLKFLKPATVAGREVLYVEGERSGDMLVRKGGTVTPYVTLRIDPEGVQAKRASQYPVTQSGFRYMIEELKARMETEMEHALYEVKEYEGAKLDGRPCRHLVVRHRKRHPELDFHSARVFLDKERGLPVYFAAYEWPEAEGEEPRLLEEFLFTRITLNPGFAEKDFQEENPEYGFRLAE